MKSKTDHQEWESVSIELPVRYWIVALGAVDGFFKQSVMPLIKEARAKGISEKEMPMEQRNIVAGTLSARAAIVSALVKAGAMKADSEETAGLTFLKQMQVRGKKAKDARDNPGN